MLRAAVNKQGKMLVIWAKPTGEGDVSGTTLLYSSLTLELPPTPTATREVLTPTLLPPTLHSPTATAEHSPTPASTFDSAQVNSQGQTDHDDTNGRTSPFIMALIPVTLLLFTVLGLVIRRAARGQDR